VILVGFLILAKYPMKKPNENKIIDMRICGRIDLFFKKPVGLFVVTLVSEFFTVFKYITKVILQELVNFSVPSSDSSEVWSRVSLNINNN